MNKSHPFFVDLHMHSNFSDGEYDVLTLIKICHDKGYRAISITDHDSIDSYYEGKDHAEKLGLELVPGVEMSTHTDGSEIHILGYLFNPSNLNLNVKLLELQQFRQNRVQKIVEKLQKNGIHLSLKRVMEHSKGTSVGRPHIAKVLVEEEYVNSFSDAFKKYLHADFVREFEQEKMVPLEAIELIHQAGGVAVMAHPGKTKRDDLIEELANGGLQGIETYTRGSSSRESQKYQFYAKKYGLTCCGGTDFHGDFGDKRFGLGSVKVPYSALESLRKSNSHRHMEK